MVGQEDLCELMFDYAPVNISSLREPNEESQTPPEVHKYMSVVPVLYLGRINFLQLKYNTIG